jgi:serine protease Do
MRKGFYIVGFVALLAAVALVYGTRVDAQDTNRLPLQRWQGAFLPLVGPGSSIGITVRDTDTGVVVQEVRSDTPASRAGLQAGDVVTEFDGERTRSAAQFTRLVRETAPGRTVRIAVLREGKQTTMDIAPEGRDAADLNIPDITRDFQRHFPGWPSDFTFDFDGDGGVFTRLSQRRLGVTVAPLSDQLATYFGVKQGVLVSAVTAGSAAETAGLKAGDVITMVRGQSVSDPGDVVRELSAAESGTSVEIRVTRDRKEITLTAKMPERTRGLARRSGRFI